MTEGNNGKTLYSVGYVEICFFDDERKSWSGFGARPLRTSIWYPADTVVNETLMTVGGAAGKPLFIIGNVAENALLAPAADCYPVVLISHGTGGSALGMGWLGIRLARLGYIAVAVNHHGNTAIEPYLAAGFACW